MAKIYSMTQLPWPSPWPASADTVTLTVSTQTLEEKLKSKHLALVVMRKESHAQKKQVSDDHDDKIILQSYFNLRHRARGERNGSGSVAMWHDCGHNRDHDCDRD